MAGPSRTLPKSQSGNNDKNPDTSDAVKGATGSGAKPKRQLIPVYLHTTDRQ